MNRKQRRSLTKKSRPLSSDEKRRASRRAEQLYVWRYCENHWWRMSTGWGFRGFIPEDQKAEAHNLALALPMRWQAISITYLEDHFGRRYRQFGFARTNQAFRGIKQGIVPLLNQCLEEAESNLNARHIYGRGMVFSPLTKHFDDLLPILKLRQERLRLTDRDLVEIGKHEEKERSRQIFIPGHDDLDSQIAEMMATEA